jgi:hypothetical protein
MFINWTLLFVPFIPFIVVFGNTIAQNDRRDLALLEQVVETVQSASQVTTAIEKLKIACERFCLVAQAYLSQQDASNANGFGGRQDSGVMNRSNQSAVDLDTVTQGNQSAAFSSAVGATSIGAGVFDSLPDFPWDGMLSEWDLGLGAESAREMGSFFGQQVGAGGGGQGNIGGVGFH